MIFGLQQFLGAEAVHAITNPLATSSGAIHVYGGDLLEPANRSMWKPHTGEHENYDAAQLAKYVAEMSDF